MGTTALTLSNEEMEDIRKVVKSLEKSGLLIKGVNETITNEAKEKKCEFLGMLLGTLGARFLENMLAGKSTIPGRRVIRPGEGLI